MNKYYKIKIYFVLFAVIINKPTKEMKNLSKSVLLIASIILFSCSKDDSTPTYTTTPPVDYSAEAPISGQFQRNVLMEDYTGTWCGYCPRMAYGIQKVEEQGIRSIPVALHGGSNTEPFLYNGTLPTTILGYPTGKLNRLTDWDYLSASDVNKVKKLNGNNCPIGLAMNSTITGSAVNLDVKIKFKSDYTGLKLVVYVVEDGLIYNQSNYTSYYGGASVISGFRHDNVLRACYTDIYGDSLTGTTDGATVTKNFSVNVPANVQNVANMRFVAFVVDSSGRAINVRETASSTENQSFEQNP
jgi:hypothetical protein